DRTRNINITLDEVVAELHKADPNYKWDDTSNSNFPFATLALVADQDHYTLLDSALVIHRVRIKDTNGVFQTLRPANRNELTDSEIDGSGTATKYHKIGQAVFPTPVPNYASAGGVELTFQRGGNHFDSTDTDEEPGFNPQFHQLLSLGASHRYAVANGLTKKIRNLFEQKTLMLEKLRTHYERRSPDDRTRFRLKRSAQNYGLTGGSNSGF
ncbi:hypothetical protein LCGC14_1956220, partial [marine sediment metagenome]